MIPNAAIQTVTINLEKINEATNTIEIAKKYFLFTKDEVGIYITARMLDSFCSNIKKIKTSFFGF